MTVRPVPPIDVALVRRLVASQFPRWADLPVRPVAVGGWDNRTFHLGDEMTVRLPSAAGYVPQVAKEQRWLPVLAPGCRCRCPARWPTGSPARATRTPGRSTAGSRARPPPPRGSATRSGSPPTSPASSPPCTAPAGGPPAGAHSAFRGAPLATYDGETRRAVELLGDRIPTDTVNRIWATAMRSTWTRPPVWFHGDVAWGNLLVRDGRLAAVIDFGCCGMGDPACDLAIAWTLLAGPSRAAFRATLGVDDATWARGRGWVLWKALITLDNPDPVRAAEARHMLDAVLTEYAESTRK